MRRLRVVVETGLAVAAIVLAKLIVHALSWEFITLSPLYTSIVAGGIFVIGLIVAGTVLDDIESEKMPPGNGAALTHNQEGTRARKEQHGKRHREHSREALEN